MFQRIRDLREDSDLTQTKLGKILNCSQRSYCDYELGTAKLPVDILISLSKFHGVTTDYILGLTDKKN